jgi:hypothetical protein
MFIFTGHRPETAKLLNTECEQNQSNRFGSIRKNFEIDFTRSHYFLIYNINDLQFRIVISVTDQNDPNQVLIYTSYMRK